MSLAASAEPDAVSAPTNSQTIAGRLCASFLFHVKQRSASPTFVALLDRWRRKTNLISNSTFASVWTRHIADSAQLLALAPHARRWVDMGSGAGFPGLVIAIQLADVPGAIVHCIESDATEMRVPPRSGARHRRRGRRFIPSASKRSTPKASDLWTP